MKNILDTIFSTKFWLYFLLNPNLKQKYGALLKLLCRLLLKVGLSVIMNTELNFSSMCIFRETLDGIRDQPKSQKTS